jgi:gliding motility-associated-like protein
MKKNLTGILFFCCFSFFTKAAHLTGGEIYYTLVSQSGSNFTYAITVKLFKDASVAVALDNPINIAIYTNGTNALAWSGQVTQTSLQTLTATPGPCIINPPVVSYQVGLYTFTVTLPASTNGYTISWARCCRINNISNLIQPSSSYGSVYTAEIPGNGNIVDGPTNNSARFLGIDTVIICAGYQFTYNFGATDADGDLLTYEFGPGFTYPGVTVPNPPPPPPYNPLPYQAPFSSVFPMGDNVGINSATGVITGTAPAAGIYVVTVYVKEWRNGQLLATQRKDLLVKVADCDVATVTLEPNGYTNCTDFTVSFSNVTPNPFINSYFWDFGDLSVLSDTSNLSSPSYTYPDTGLYTVKVVGNRNQPCSDSTTALVRVYPVFIPANTSTGICINSPVDFFDFTFATYGTVNFWKWDFGVPSLANDTSRIQNPQYTYTSPGSYTTSMIVGSTQGCLDTIYQTINIIDKPSITMAFHDTLICSVDTIQLNASGSSGAISWTPNYNIINGTSVAPLVYPKVDTWYKVEFNDNGCRNQDSVRVRVVNSVTINASNDTTICANDPVNLFANTNGFQYAWSPATNLSSTSVLTPVATPTATTTYQFTSVIGGCQSVEDVTITVLPRPTVNAGNDVTICYNTATQLSGSTNGTTFSWSPAASLSDGTVLNPFATPLNTTSYILTSANTTGCTKPAYDTIIVTVLPEVRAFAGNDTVIIAGMPLQMRATGGVSYQWSPATNLDNPNIAGPVALLDGNPEYVTYMVTVADQFGCTDTSDITIRVYKTGPEIFVPTGFTPNGDGRNDVFRPIYIGMKTVDFFQVYNRWGQLIYSNNKMDGKGWDGMIKGLKQNSGTYIWMVQATDIIGKLHFKKGTVELIR